MVNRGPLLVRADASTAIGTGHLMRCLALAQRWRDSGGQVIFLSVCDSDALRRSVQQESAEFVAATATIGSDADATEVIRLARQHSAPWVVIDGYNFGAAYQQTIKRAGMRLLTIDDTGEAAPYCADIVLNQNITANESLYEQREPHTKLLLGTNYVLLRREFTSRMGQRRQLPPKAHRLLVTMGGSDPENVMEKILRGLHQCRALKLEVRAIIGAANPHVKSLRTVARESGLEICLEEKVADMSAMMAWADVAISAAGTTLWELAFMGVPVITVEVADHQRPIGAAAAQRRVSVNLGWHASLAEAAIAEKVRELVRDGDRRRQMSERGQRLVDGRGASRVLEQLLAASGQ